VKMKIQENHTEDYSRVKKLILKKIKN